MIPFQKNHGAGNDFVLVDAREPLFKKLRCHRLGVPPKNQHARAAGINSREHPHAISHFAPRDPKAE